MGVIFRPIQREDARFFLTAVVRRITMKPRWSSTMAAPFTIPAASRAAME